VFSELGVGDKDWETFNAGNAFSSGAHFNYFNFIRFAKFYWAFASAAFALGISWASLSWTNRTILS